MSTLLDHLNFSGKNVLVTGGSKGIGRAIVLGFAELGAKVFFSYRTHDNSVTELEGWSSAHGGRLVGIANDVSDLASVLVLARKIGDSARTLDVLVNNVGDVVRRSSFVASDDALWTSALNVNLLSTVRTTQALLPLLDRSSTGVIINVASIAARSGGGGDSLHYAVAKAGVVTFTQGLARELKHIRVVGVAPSAIETDFQRRHSSAERLKNISDTTPLGRIGTTREVADTVLFLASDAASFISGETIFITGGR